jgi:hypothetical protein
MCINNIYNVFLLYYIYKRISCILLCMLPFIYKYQDIVYLLPQSSFWNYVHVYTFVYICIYIYIYVCVCMCVCVYVCAL